MPIKSTDTQGNVTFQHHGCVVEVRKSIQRRNHSDTLDYSDFQDTNVTEALVYVGRFAEWPGARKELAPIDRFQYVDCTCLFRDRGQDYREPSVDDIRHPDCVIDYVEFCEAREQKRIKDEATAFANEQKCIAAREEEIRNRPVVGKQMVVKSGRKVKPGTVGTVAFVSDNRVLLKDDDKWEDRKADGVWVQAQHLKAR